MSRRFAHRQRAAPLDESIGEPALRGKRSPSPGAPRACTFFAMPELAHARPAAFAQPSLIRIAPRSVLADDAGSALPRGAAGDARRLPRRRRCHAVAAPPSLALSLALSLAPSLARCVGCVLPPLGRLPCSILIGTQHAHVRGMPRGAAGDARRLLRRCRCHSVAAPPSLALSLAPSLARCVIGCVLPPLGGRFVAARVSWRI